MTGLGTLPWLATTQYRSIALYVYITLYRVTCNAAGRVTKLNLAHAHANGTIPANIGELRALRELDLNDNAALHGSLPSVLNSALLCDFLL